MKRIVSRVALAALITTTITPVAQADASQTKALLKYFVLPFAGLMATGKAISYGYKWYKKDAIAKLAADKETAKKKTEELKKLQIELGELLNKKAELKSSFGDSLSSEADRQALAKHIEEIDAANQIPTEAHITIDKMIAAKKAAIEAKRAEIPAINDPFNAGDFGDNLFKVTGITAVTLPLAVGICAQPEATIFLGTLSLMAALTVKYLFSKNN
ncbi:MAG: hypothetical protein ACHQVS_03020 [Candidatus Babeliales bacterium]